MGFTGDNEDYVGRMYRISGFDSGTPIDVIDAVGATGTSQTPQAGTKTGGDTTPRRPENAKGCPTGTPA